MKENYRDELVARIKEIGQELIDRADSMIAEDVDMIGDFTIYIDVSVVDALPTIEYTTTVASKNTLKRLIEKEN